MVYTCERTSKGLDKNINHRWLSESCFHRTLQRLSSNAEIGKEVGISMHHPYVSVW